ncbi:catechol 2,3-dioxygenase-like lactoylglutathione lyase family enzyme [Collimonas sp. PA-H2]|uniref:VOC family protein n=1 Tax=Collimonas sp. PA-H2 TaxID=1881062 RepID=UPI000BF9072B|nr:VOC family protein [Collimonas sp. PA-H2]PFH08926.1 catechol 2,3-dioxygenase-like lactoylglutathione lyase family enzyme [Collimonas sp. PA-H2]
MQIHTQAKLNHLSFPTTNVAETAAFFEKYLGCEIVAFGDSCLLKRHDFDIVLDYVSEEAPAWPKNFHFGVELDSLDDVHALYKEFLENGVHMETEVFNNSRGSRFFCRTPGGVLLEVNTRADMQQQEQWQKLFS